MRADIDAAVKIVRAAAGFDWSWAVADLERFSETLDWEVSERRPRGATLDTGLHVNWPKANAIIDAAGVREITVWVSDIAETLDDIVSCAIADGFEEIHAQLVEYFGPPSREVIGEVPRSGWQFPNVVVFLTAGLKALEVSIVNPDHQRRLDIPEQTTRIWKF
ncbi:DUF6301 family protein [Nocardia sp. NPDC004151]|uniref:DUF6301 family protein n=1 Tax=Nocardia sp. NPDC004151 TaxID=3364304 RepID=UPI00368F9539